MGFLLKWIISAYYRLLFNRHSEMCTKVQKLYSASTGVAWFRNIVAPRPSAFTPSFALHERTNIASRQKAFATSSNNKLSGEELSSVSKASGPKHVTESLSVRSCSSSTLYLSTSTFHSSIRSVILSLCACHSIFYFDSTSLIRWGFSPSSLPGVALCWELHSAAVD